MSWIIDPSLAHMVCKVLSIHTASILILNTALHCSTIPTSHKETESWPIGRGNMPRVTDKTLQSPGLDTACKAQSHFGVLSAGGCFTQSSIHLWANVTFSKGTQTLIPILKDNKVNKRKHLLNWNKTKHYC